MGIKDFFSQLIAKLQEDDIWGTGELERQGGENDTSDIENLQVLSDISKLQGAKIYPEPINMSIQSRSSAEGYVEYPDVQVEFFVTIDIPQNTQLISRAAYRLDMSMDGSFVKLLICPTIRRCVIYVEDEAGNTVELNTTTGVNQVKLGGMLSYNVLLKGFEAIEAMGDHYSTEVSQSGTQDINQVLGFTSVNYTEEENPFREYAITLVNNPQIMVILPDSQQTVQEGSEEFFEMIENSQIQRILGKKYMLIISPSPDPVS